MTRRLFIIGGGREQLPAIERAKGQGLWVAVADKNPDAPGRKLADAFFPVSTSDAAGAIEAARQCRPDGVMTLSSETAVPTVAAAADAMGLPGFTIETARLATDKLAMKEAFLAHRVPTTPFAQVSSVEEACGFAQLHGLPIVLKPAVNSGQRGTSRVDRIEDIEAAFQDARANAPDGRVLVETFAKGPEYNVTAVVSDGVPEILSVSERVTAAAPHFGIAIAHAAKPVMAAADHESLRDAVRLAVQAIGLESGVVYPQFILSPDGPKLLEIAIRIPGGYMREVAWYLSGIDLVDVVIAQALGEGRPLETVTRRAAVEGLCVRFITALDGNRIRAHPTMKRRAQVGQMAGIEAVHWHLGDGQPIPDLTHSGARFAAVIAVGSDRPEAEAHAEAAVGRLLEPEIDAAGAVDDAWAMHVRSIGH